MENISEHIEEDETPVEKTGYDAVPIHFRPGKGITKKIKLVVPGFDDWMVKMTIEDGPAGSIVYTIDDNDSESESSEPEGDMLEVTENTAIDNVDADNDTVVDEGPRDAEDQEMVEAEDENMEAMDNILEELPDAAPEPEAETAAGFLIALDSDAEQQVIVVRSMEDESDEDAVKRVLEDNDGFRVGTLEEATKLLGHDPLTSKDNWARWQRAAD